MITGKKTYRSGLIIFLLLVINIATSFAQRIRDYDFEGIDTKVDIGSNTIDVTVPSGTDVTNLVAVFRLSGGASAYVNGVLQVSGETPNDFQDPVTYIVYDNNGDSRIYVVTVNVAPNNQTDFLSFSFPEQTTPAEIDTDRHRINIEVAYGTDVSNLIATFELSYGAVAMVYNLFFWQIQVSGETANDFTNTVTYRIIAEDGSTRQDWRITVTIAPPPEAEILTYSIPGQIGSSDIDPESQTVVVNMPYETDPTSLIGTFTLSHGATATVDGVTQVSGVTPNDFTSPVVYRVTAYDGLTFKNWTVTVNVSPNDEAEILSYAIPEQTGEASIDSRDGTVDVEVAFGTDLSGLVATFTLSPQATATVYGIDQISGSTINDFTEPLTYIVRAGDNSTKEWTVTVTEAPNDETDFLSYNLPGQVGSSRIDTNNKRIEIDLSYTSELDNLIATFSLSPEAIAEVNGITQVSGVTPNDFNDIVIYTVTAGDGSTQEWDVIVNVLPNNQTDILEFSFEEQTGPADIDAENHIVQIEVHNGADSGNLIATFTLSPLATAFIETVEQQSGLTSNDFSNPVTYTILAGDQTTAQDWEVMVTVRPPSSDTDFVSFGFDEQVGESWIDTINHEIFVYVVEGTQLDNLVALFTLSTGATAYVDNIIQISGETINDFSEPVEYTIIAEDNTNIQTWKVFVSIALDFFYIKKPLEFPVSNKAIEVSAGSSEYESFESVIFNYKRIEDQSWTSRDVVGNQGIYKFDITRDMMGDLGVYYYFNALDNSGRSIPLDYQHLVLYYNQDFPRIPNLRFGETVNHYQIISIPLDLRNTNAEMVFDELGEYNIKQWRLFHYDGSSTKEYKNGFTNIDPGKGYWLIARDQAVIDTGEGRTVRIDSTNGFEIYLEPGWNQIGNPFDMDISWDNVIIDNNNLNIGRVKLFDRDSLSEAYVIPQFRGGFVFLQGIQPITVKVRPTTVNLNARIQSFTGHLRQNPLDNPEWIVGLHMTNGTVTNTLSGIGMHPEAAIGRDAYDDVLLPMPTEIMPFELSFYHPDEKYNKLSLDVTKATDQYIWSFDVKSFIPSQALTISWDKQRLVKSEFNLILNHLGTEKLINMKEVNSYTFTSGESNNFRIIFGDDDFLKKELKPKSVTFGNGYPNPFTDRVTVPFTLPENQSDYLVEISVYDLTGNKVKQLTNSRYTPGYYNVSWNALEQENRISKGIYILKMVIRSDNINTVLTQKVLKY